MANAKTDSILRENCLCAVGQVVSVNMQTEDVTTLFTVPVGKQFTPFAIAITNATDTLAGCVVTAGQSGALTDFLGNQTLTNVNATGDACWLMPIPAATPVGIVTYSAGEIFQLDVATQSTGAASADLTAFGFVNDA